jgi:hypothetical protein
MAIEIKYAHSPAHHAVAARDHAALRRVVDALPRGRRPEEIRTEADSVAEEARAEAVSAVVDRRNVSGPGDATPPRRAPRRRRGGRDAHGGGMLTAALELEQGSLLATATPTTHRSAKQRRRWRRERRFRT